MAVCRYVLLGVMGCLLAAVGTQLYFENLAANDSLFKRRPVPYWEFPARSELQEQAHTRMHAVTCVHYTTQEELVFTTHHNHGAVAAPLPADGTYPFPDLYYEGAVYAVSAWHQMNRWQSAKRNREQNEELLAEIQRMWPRPTLVVPYSTIDTGADFTERGFALHFELVTREVELAVLGLARVFGQVQVTRWWGHAWGVHPRKHVTVMQGLLPVASAVRPVKTESPIHLVVPTPKQRKFFAERWMHDEAQGGGDEGGDL